MAWVLKNLNSDEGTICRGSRIECAEHFWRLRKVYEYNINDEKEMEELATAIERGYYNSRYFEWELREEPADDSFRLETFDNAFEGHKKDLRLLLSEKTLDGIDIDVINNAKAALGNIEKLAFAVFSAQHD